MKKIIIVLIAMFSIWFNSFSQKTHYVLNQAALYDSAEKSEYIAVMEKFKNHTDSVNNAYQIERNNYEQAEIIKRKAQGELYLKHKEIKVEAEVFIPMKPWQKLDIDSVTFTERYGTEFQYAYQQQIENKSTHKTLFIWTGAQYMYIFNYAYFLGGDIMNFNISMAYFNNITTITATPKIYQGNKLHKIITKVHYNLKGQITFATITGPVDDVINIFANYWELSTVSYNELKTKKRVVKEFVSDKISLSLLGSGASISITKNKNAVMDLFKFN